MQAGCDGFLALYLDTAAAVGVNIAFQIIARETTTLDERVGPIVRDSRMLDGGMPWSHTSAYRYEVPFSLSWLFSGSYWQSTPALAPGLAGIPSVPTLIDNFLGAGTWQIFLAVDLDFFVPVTGAAAANVEDVRISLGGWVHDLPGSVSYAPGIPFI